MENHAQSIVARPQEDVDGDGRWLDLHYRFVSEAKSKEPDVLFIGDSHIASLEQSRAYRDLFEQFHCLCFGIQGDDTSNVLWRVLNGELECFRPKVVVLSVGANNHYQTADQILRGIVAIVKAIDAKQPQAIILTLTIPPSGHKPNKRRELLQRVNDNLPRAVGHVTNCQVLDTSNGLLSSDGTIERTDMYDYFNFTDSGFRKAFDMVHSVVRDLLGAE